MTDTMSTTKEKDVTLWEETGSIVPRMKSENNGELDGCDITTNINDSKELGHLTDITGKKKVSGIYKIVNKVNGKYYVGSSDDIRRRIYHHIRDLMSNVHPNKKLQRAWRKYGHHNFEFIIIEKCDANLLLLLEQEYLTECKKRPQNNYNLSYDALAPFKGKQHTAAARLKIGNSNRGRSQSLELRNRKSVLMVGRYDGSNNPNYGNKMSAKTKLAISNSCSDKSIYTFRNIVTNETFYGTRLEFRTYINVGRDSVYQLINKITCSCKGWVVV